MMDAMAAAMDRRPPRKLPVPLLTPYLSSLWIGLVTPVDAEVAKPLIEGASHGDGGQGPLRDGAVRRRPDADRRGDAGRRSPRECQARLGGGLAVDGRALGPQRWQVASLERAQEAARDQDVDPQLGLRVDEGAEARERGPIRAGRDRSSRRPRARGSAPRRRGPAPGVARRSAGIRGPRPLGATSTPRSIGQVTRPNPGPVSYCGSRKRSRTKRRQTSTTEREAPEYAIRSSPSEIRFR